MHENDIFIRENDTSMQENENFTLGMISFATEMSIGG